jgi:hypothetical protein
MIYISEVSHHGHDHNDHHEEEIHTEAAAAAHA